MPRSRFPRGNSFHLIKKRYLREDLEEELAAAALAAAAAICKIIKARAHRCKIERKVPRPRARFISLATLREDGLCPRINKNRSISIGQYQLSGQRASRSSGCCLSAAKARMILNTCGSLARHQISIIGPSFDACQKLD